MTCTDVAIIGAGPYGLAAAAHLRRAGVDTHILGEPHASFPDTPVGGGGSGGRPSPRRGVHHARSAGSARLESYQETAV
jgi:2-polyprenyl-6-methoxyphenol hydroxylase-like FAD-dependent oxidoreductase